MRIELANAVVALNKGRRYASWFEWTDKQIKELGVVEELITAVAHAESRVLRKPTINALDPPDCICLDESGARVAVEVTEVVCDKAVALNAQGHEVYRHWQPGELEPHITRALMKKDVKLFHGGPYQDILACLFTDEPTVTLAFANQELSKASFGPFRQITSAYLLFSYDPGTKTYPVLPLRINA